MRGLTRTGLDKDDSLANGEIVKILCVRKERIARFYDHTKKKIDIPLDSAATFAQVARCERKTDGQTDRQTHRHTYNRERAT